MTEQRRILEKAFQDKKEDEAAGYDWRCLCTACSVWRSRGEETFFAALQRERDHSKQLQQEQDRKAGKLSSAGDTVTQSDIFDRDHGDLVPAVVSKPAAPKPHRDRSNNPLSGLGGGGRRRS